MMGMKEQDKNKRLKNNLKNSRAKIKRRDEKIAQLEARIVQMQEESKKKCTARHMDSMLQSIAERFQDTNSQSSSSDTRSLSDAKQTAALEILSRLLRN
jgi:molecular chaperone GrpE (heat shock protein)